MKLKMFMKDYKITIIVSFIVILLGVLIYILYSQFFNKNVAYKEFSNDYFSLNYDANWRISKTSDDTINLEHGSDSTVNMSIVQLSEEYKYSNIDEVMDEVIYNIGIQNPKYNMIAKEPTTITKNNYDGYKLLYETEEEQVLVIIAKYNDKLLITTFTSTNDYFDMLLDSVHNIVYNFEFKEEKLDFTYQMEDIKTNAITWKENENLNSELKENNKYSIANNNFLVEYSIPKNFELSDYDSSSNYFNFRGDLEGNIILKANVSGLNMYEYLNSESNGLNYDMKNIRDDSKTYTDLKETLQKIDDPDVNGYIFKASYDYESTYSSSYNENVYIIYELDNRRTFVIEINSEDESITKELIDSIKFINKKKYAEFIYRNIENDNLINELKAKINDYSATTQKYYSINLYTPKKYREIDKGNNMYDSRYFGDGYDEENDEYDTNICYNLSVLEYNETKPSTTSSCYKNYTYTNVISNGQIILNGKTFYKFSGTFSANNVDYIDTLLFYKLENGGYISIIISDKNGDIAEATLDELTNFNIEIKDF